MKFHYFCSAQQKKTKPQKRIMIWRTSYKSPPKQFSLIKVLTARNINHCNFQDTFFLLYSLLGIHLRVHCYHLYFFLFFFSLLSPSTFSFPGSDTNKHTRQTEQVRVGFPIGIPLHAIVRNCTQLFLYCAE